MNFIREMFEFLRMRRKLWMFPLIFALLILCTLLLLAQSTALAPFIYTLF